MPMIGDNIPEDAPVEVLVQERIRKVLDTFSESERKILIFRFGLDGEKPHSLEEVSNEFNVSCERIRQIEGKASSTRWNHTDDWRKKHKALVDALLSDEK